MLEKGIALPGFEDDGALSLTDDALLDGQLRLRQPRDGFRVAVDSVLLAAATPAVAGDRVMEPGCGAGGAALCLARRVAGCHVTGIEIQPALARLAEDNARRNGLAGRVEVIAGDIARPPAALAPGGFDHVLLNPPFLPPGRADAPEDIPRRTARVEGEAGLDAWLGFALRMVRSSGTVTVVHRADRLDELLSLLRGPAGGIVVYPLWPGPGARPARRVLVRAVKDSGAPLRLSRGLVLHEADGAYTAAADAALRGAALDLA